MLKHIKDYNHSEIEILREADRLIEDIHKLVGQESNHWSLSIGGLAEKRRFEAKQIVIRATLLEQMVKARTIK